MGLQVQYSDYADFQAIIASLPAKVGSVFYCTTGGFFAVAITADGQNVIGFSAGSAPGSFAADYPNAVLLNVAPVAGGNIILVL